MLRDTSPTTGLVFHGVDFSGANRHEAKIWVSTYDGSAPAVSAGGFSHGRLVERIARSSEDGRRHFWLVDSTFGLPTEMLERHSVPADWSSAARWLSTFASPRDWRHEVRSVSRREDRRVTDRLARTPFAPMNLRMFKQTWQCIVRVLLPLRDMQQVALLPFDAVSDPGLGVASAGGRPRWQDAPVWVGEGCPSSLLHAAGRPNRGYKGSTETNRARREELLRALETGDGIPVDPATLRRAIEDTEGDVLDSLLLLPSASRFAALDHAAVLATEARAGVEGWVYI